MGAGSSRSLKPHNVPCTVFDGPSYLFILQPQENIPCEVRSMHRYAMTQGFAILRATTAHTAEDPSSTFVLSNHAQLLDQFGLI